MGIKRRHDASGGFDAPGDAVPAASAALGSGASAPADALAGVQVENLTVRFGARTVLDDLSLTLKRGELLTVLGRSGCGKTTLLRFIAGFVEAERGRLSIAGRDLSATPPHRRNLGLLFQSYALFPHLSVFENVAFGLRARGIRGNALSSRVAAVLKLVQLGDAGHLLPAALSGGMQQRVALARALVIEPEVLLLDEPASALDPISTLKIEELIHELKDRFTIAIVTHNMQQAARVSDYTAFMYLGKVIEFGDTDTLFTNPSNKQTEDYITGRYG